MATEISVSIPRELVTPQEFANMEGIARSTVYAWTHQGKLGKYLIKKVEGHARSRINYLKYKQDQMRDSLGHSNFKIIVGA